MINKSILDEEGTLKISLIDTRSRQPETNFCRKYFVDCFVHFLFRKKPQTSTFNNPPPSNSSPSRYSDQAFLPSDFPEIICGNQTQKSRKNFRTKYKIESFPLNELFLFECDFDHKPILVKVTEKYFFSKSENYEENAAATIKDSIMAGNSFFSTSSQSMDRASKQFKKIPACFPFFSDKISYNPEYFNESDLPDEIFSDYLASKLQGALTLDFSAGLGEYTISIAKKSNFVISCSNNSGLTEDLRRNCSLYGLNNVDFINLDETGTSFKEFLSFTNKNNKADSVLINPLALIRNFSSKKISDLYLTNLMKHLAKTSKNFAIVLPKHFQNFEGLASLISISLKKANGRCGVEIEKIFQNKKLKHLVVYYGLISSIKGSEEMAFIHNMVEKYDNRESSCPEHFKNSFRCISNQISNSFGNLALLELVAEASRNYLKEKSKNIYTNILEIFKKNTIGIVCLDSSKECKHETGLVKSQSSYFDSSPQLMTLKPKSVNSCEENLSTITEANHPKNHNSQSANNMKGKPLVALESFTSDANEIVSNYSKSFQETQEFENGLNERKIKRSESGVQNPYEAKFGSFGEGPFYNSLREKNLM